MSLKVSRFRGQLSHSRLRKESKTHALFGSHVRGNGLDANKYYRCWHCGFICNVERDALGDSQSKSGAVYEDYSTPTDPGYSYPENETGISINNQTAVLDGLVASELDSNGDAVTVQNAIWVSNRSRGCPLCNTLNWRGDY